MENTKKKDLWKMTKDSIHVKFFQWMWGIYAPDKYKTACPYYWQFAGSIVILPIIILAKLGAWLLKPLAKVFKVYYISKSADKISALVLRAENATTDAELYEIYKTKCFQYHRWENEFNDVYGKILNGYDAHKKVLDKAKNVRQAKMDAFKYGPWGTILTYIIGLVILLLVGWFIYEFLHLFTWPDFKGFSLTLLAIIGVCIVVTFMVGGLINLYDKYVCDSWVGSLRPLKWIAWPFKMIWIGILMTVDMIKSVYTKSCPTIDWK